MCTFVLFQTTKEKIYNVLLFVDGGWMVDQREVCFGLPLQDMRFSDFDYLISGLVAKI